MSEDATFPLIEAVKGMLPKNSLGYHMLKKLNVYADAVHPQAALAQRAFFRGRVGAHSRHPCRDAGRSARLGIRAAGSD
jgi:hypothetical protein